VRAATVAATAATGRKTVTAITGAAAEVLWRRWEQKRSAPDDSCNDRYCRGGDGRGGGGRGGRGWKAGRVFNPC
jgi:hypothetical protein